MLELVVCSLRKKDLTLLRIKRLSSLIFLNCCFAYHRAICCKLGLKIGNFFSPFLKRCSPSPQQCWEFCRPLPGDNWFAVCWFVTAQTWLWWLGPHPGPLVKEGGACAGDPVQGCTPAPRMHALPWAELCPWQKCLISFKKLLIRLFRLSRSPCIKTKLFYDLLIIYRAAKHITPLETGA